jgi:hypothetical protein
MLLINIDILQNTAVVKDNAKINSESPVWA